MKKKLIKSLTLALSTFSLHASDVQLWTTFSPSFNFRFLYHPSIVFKNDYEMEWHFTDYIRKGSYAHYEDALMLRIAKNWYFGGEARHIVKRSHDTITRQWWSGLRLEATFPIKSFELKSRLRVINPTSRQKIQILNNGYIDYQKKEKRYWAGRFKNQLNFFKTKYADIYASEEIFLNINNTGTFDRNELSLGVDFKFFKEALRFSLRYLLQNDRQSKSSWELNHVFGMHLFFRI